MLTLGLVQTAFAGIIFLGGLRATRTDHAAILTYTEPVAAVVFAAAFLGEALTAWTAIGGAMVVAGGLTVARLSPAAEPARCRSKPPEPKAMMQSGDSERPSSGTIAPEGPRTRGDAASERNLMDALSRLASTNAIDRLRSRDATLFASDAEGIALAAGSLGWTDLDACCQPLPEYRKRTVDELGDDLTDVVVLGMGGSSLATLVIGEVLAESCCRRLHVLDTTAPRTVSAALGSLDPATTVVPRVEQVGRHGRAARAVRDLPRRGRRALSAEKRRETASSRSPTPGRRSRPSPSRRAFTPSSTACRRWAGGSRR